MRFSIPESTLARLREKQNAQRYRDEVAEAEQAFVLDPGMGPAAYLTSDGRVLIDGRYWDETPLREANDDEAVSAIIVGAKKTGISELLALLPKRPHGAQDCGQCSGSGWLRVGTDVVTGEPGQIICFVCGGRGWIPPVSTTAA